MRTIGFLGGMSWESTAIYYRLANEYVRDRLGGLHSAKIVLHSVDFAEIEALQFAGDWDAAGTILAEAARGLELAGADLIVLCTNTMHLVAPAIEAAISVPFLHLADATADAVKAEGLSKVGLLGTIFTMEQDFYRDRLAANGLDVIVPESTDRQRISRVIYDELCLGIVTEESRAFYLSVIDRLVAEGAEAIVLGCTEIEMLVDETHTDVPLFPTTRLHVRAAVDASIG